MTHVRANISECQTNLVEQLNLLAPLAQLSILELLTDFAEALTSGKYFYTKAENEKFRYLFENQNRISLSDLENI